MVPRICYSCTPEKEWRQRQENPPEALKPASLEQLHKSENNKGTAPQRGQGEESSEKMSSDHTGAVRARVCTHTHTQIQNYKQTQSSLPVGQSLPSSSSSAPPLLNSMEMPYFATCFCLLSSIASPLPFPEKTPIRHLLTLVCEPAALQISRGGRYSRVGPPYE